MPNVPFTSVTLIDGVWKFTWAGGLGTVRVVLWGILVEETDESSYDYPASALHASQTTAPPLEVVLAGEEAVSERNLPYIVLQWYRVDCSHYVIEYKDGSDWVFHSTISDSDLVHIQTYTTQVLDDQTTTRWRVTAVDVNKRESNPVTFAVLIIRPPDVPRGLSVSCVAGVVTVE